MRIIHLIIYTLSLFASLSFSGTTSVSPAQSETIPPVQSVPVDIIAENPNQGSGWWSKDPGLVIVASTDDLMTIRHLLHPQHYQQVQAVDYDQDFAVAIFHGAGCSTYSACGEEFDAPDIEIEQIEQQSLRFDITASSHLVPLAGFPDWSSSTYIVIKMPKGDERDKEGTFTLTLNDKTTITETHYIPNGRLIPDDATQQLTFESLRKALGAYNFLWDDTPSLVLAHSHQDIRLLESMLGRNFDAFRDIDYHQYFIAALFQGDQGSTGYDIALEQVRRNGHQLSFYAYARSPFVGEATGGAAEPHQIVQIAREDYDWSGKTEVDVFFNGTQHVLTQTHYLAPPNPTPTIFEPHYFETVERQIGPSGWTNPEAGFRVITQPHEVDALAAFISSEAIDLLRQVDYDRFYVIAAFQGQQPASWYTHEIEVYGIRQAGSHLVVDTHVKWPLPPETEPPVHLPTPVPSPYHLIQVNRPIQDDIETSLNAGEIESTEFAWVVNSKVVLTQTHVITPQLPSVLQGYFAPRQKREGESYPVYEIVLDNPSEQTISDISLSLAYTTTIVDFHYFGLLYNDLHGWTCKNEYTDCSQEIGDLEPSEQITRTFVATRYYTGLAPTMRAAQTCISSTGTIEYPEPIVTVHAHTIEPRPIRGTGEKYVYPYQTIPLCPAIEPGSTSGEIYLVDSPTLDSNIFLYEIRVHRYYDVGTIGTLYFDDQRYEINEHYSDDVWRYDDFEFTPNETNRWRLDFGERFKPTGTVMIDLAIQPLVSINTQNPPIPNVVLDGPAFNTEPILLTEAISILRREHLLYLPVIAR
ncbi:MAG: hypothetical protein AAF639_32425 [Chloroflexota bacterium]